MNAKETATTISQSTPVTLGLVGAIVAGVFFSGVAWQRLNNNDAADLKRDVMIEKMDRQINQNQQQLQQGEYRIERLEELP